MTIVIMASSNNVFVNPDNVAIENLKLKVGNSGVILDIPAIDKHWVSKRKLNVYIPPPTGEKLPFGALDVWKQSIEVFIDNLKWLLSLKYQEFWSNILFHSQCMDMLVSFLQEATPPYLVSELDPTVQELYNETYKKVFVVFTRLITNKESNAEWMNKSHLGKILYDKYIFTIPILFDLCLLYGINNISHVGIIVKSVFAVQPNYNEDLKKAILFLKQIFNFVSLEIDSRSNMGPDPPLLPEVFKGFSKSFGGLSVSKTSGKSLSFSALYDLCLHLADCSLTVRLFMDAYPASRCLFRDQDFHISITNFYENTLPMMYKKLHDLEDDTNKMMSGKIYEYLDLIRAELVDAYRLIIATSIEDIFEKSGSVESNVNTYLTVITDVLSEKSFLKDYNTVYPVENDLDVLCEAYDKIDPMKKDFILNAVLTNCYEDLPESSSINLAVASSSEYNNTSESYNNINGAEPNNKHKSKHQNIGIPEEAKTQSLISEVKDILPHLGDGFILKCLEHYGFNTERVINGVLEGTLDRSLQSLDSSLPIIPDDPLDTQYLATGIDRLNVFDNDEFDVMTRDNVDKSRIHKGKKKFEHKNLSEMLDDKSHVKQLKDKYTKFTLICDDVDAYDDEYDDTYDSMGPEPTTDAAGDDDRRLMGRNVRKNDGVESDNDNDEEEETNDSGPSSAHPPRDAFCVNPEELRARYQARRDMKYGQRPERNVVGKAKGQGQDKEVLLNRRKKEASKSNKGNHNRRGGSQWKRSQGMVPS